MALYILNILLMIPIFFYTFFAGNSILLYMFSFRLSCFDSGFKSIALNEHFDATKLVLNLLLWLSSLFYAMYIFQPCCESTAFIL